MALLNLTGGSSPSDMAAAYRNNNPMQQRLAEMERKQVANSESGGYITVPPEGIPGHPEWKPGTRQLVGGASQSAAGAIPAPAGGAGGSAGGASGLDLTGRQSLQSLQSAAGAPNLPSPPPETGVATSMLSGQPGQMRPNLSTRRPPQDMGGLKALQRKVY